MAIEASTIAHRATLCQARGEGAVPGAGFWGCGPLALLAPLVSLARWPTTEVLGRNQGWLNLSALAPLTDNGSPRRNQGRPDLSASGALPPNPRKGRLPLDPAVVFSWSTGVAPRYPPDSAVPTLNDARYR